MMCVKNLSFVFVFIIVAVGSIVTRCGNGNHAMTQRNDPSRQVERDWMVDTQIVADGITDLAIIAAMRRVPRHRFIPDSVSEDAYGDFPLSIGHKQTISQPFIVAYMTEALKLIPGEKVLEIGTGSGYQAAILAELGVHVFSIEIVEQLARYARDNLSKLGYDQVRVRTGDGYQGWPEERPFDAIILTAAPDHIPTPLLEQLAIGGRLIIPVGDYSQNLILIRRTKQGYQRTELLPVRFVPMTGTAEKRSPNQ
jgi:protein-L-isoaspartate(D-aspartate) O-methyltransferase